MTCYNTRIAPSPTGMFHLGTARTAYFNYLTTKASGGKFLLRIDDTDILRNDEKHVETIIENLEWLKLTPDQLIRQSDRIEFYKEIAEKLINTNQAIKNDDGSVILKLPENIPCWKDKLNDKYIKINEHDRDNINGLVLLRSTINGFCFYY